MDDRQAQIKEGAGLEENRINEDLLEFLNKWSFPFLVVVGLVVGGFWAKGWFDRRHAAYVNTGFNEYSAALAGGNPNPESLRRIAQEYSDIPGLADMARLDTADLYYEAAWLGVRPGAELNPDGTLVDETDLLADDDIATYLDSAQQLYSEVQRSASEGGRTLLELFSTWGLAAVAASRDDDAGAKAIYADLADRASGAGYELIATAAQRRAEGTDDAREPRLYDASEIPPITLRTDEIVNEILNQAGLDASASTDTETSDDDAPPADAPVDESAEDSTDEPTDAGDDTPDAP